MDCLLPRTVFIIGLVLSIVGLSFWTARVQEWAGPIVAASVRGAVGGSLLSLALFNVIHGGFQTSNMGAIWSFIWNFITNVVLPSLSFWDYLAAGAMIVASFNPMVASIRVPMVIALNVMALINLQLMGCGFQMPPVEVKGSGTEN